MEIIKVPLLPIPLLTSPLKGEEPDSLPRVPGQEFYGFKGRARVGMGLRWYDAIHKGYFRYFRLPKGVRNYKYTNFVRGGYAAHPPSSDIGGCAALIYPTT